MFFFENLFFFESNVVFSRIKYSRMGIFRLSSVCRSVSSLFGIVLKLFRRKPTNSSNNNSNRKKNILFPSLMRILLALLYSLLKLVVTIMMITTISCLNCSVYCCWMDRKVDFFVFFGTKRFFSKRNFPSLSHVLDVQTNKGKNFDALFWIDYACLFFTPFVTGCCFFFSFFLHKSNVKCLIMMMVV